MAPSRKGSNGRSPLVNPQRQITAFFSKKTESSPSPSPSPSSPALSKRNPKRNASLSPSPSPITPSPIQSKFKKPLLVISPNLGSSSRESPSSDKKSYGAEVVDRRIKVYWPLDKSWYEGCVKSFDKISGKHLVKYDDAEEEMLNLGEEKIEWTEEPTKKKLRRLRKISVVEDEEEDEDLKELEDDSDDEDWGEKAEKEIEDEDDLEDMDLEVEKEESGKRGVRKKMNSAKRKVSEGERMVSVPSKKIKNSGASRNSISKASFAGNAEELIEATEKISANSK